MAFKLVELTEAVRAMFGFDSAAFWLSDPIVLDDSSDARLYVVRQAAGNDTIDHMYFEESGELTLIHRGRKIWSWSPRDHMSPSVVARRHRRICDAMAVIDSTIPLKAYSRPKDVANRNRVFMWVAIAGYLVATIAMLLLTLR